MTDRIFCVPTPSSYSHYEANDPTVKFLGGGNIYCDTKNVLLALSDFNLVGSGYQENIEEKFHRLAQEWEAATINWSSFDKMISHPAYKEIIDLGPEVVPILLAELEQAPQHWFYALREITGVSPISKSAAGNLKKMTDAWLKWGRKHGYR